MPILLYLVEWEKLSEIQGVLWLCPLIQEPFKVMSVLNEGVLRPVLRIVVIAVSLGSCDCDLDAWQLACNCNSCSIPSHDSICDLPNWFPTSKINGEAGGSLQIIPSTFSHDLTL